MKSLYSWTAMLCRVVDNANPKKNTLLSGLNAGIARLVKDGEVERLKRAYLTSPSK